MAEKNESSVVEAAAGAGAIVVQAGAVLITMNPAAVAVVAGAVVVVGIGGAIAYAISTRGKKVEMNIGDSFSVKAEFE